MLSFILKEFLLIIRDNIGIVPVGVARVVTFKVILSHYHISPIILVLQHERLYGLATRVGIVKDAIRISLLCLLDQTFLMCDGIHQRVYYGAYWEQRSESNRCDLT